MKGEEKLYVKAETLDGKIKEGYALKYNKKWYLIEKDEATEINPYTICRNTGIKDKEGKSIYENDLIECKNFFENFYGYAYFDDIHKKWSLKRSFIFGGVTDFTKAGCKIVGNVLIDDESAKIIEKQDKEEQESTPFIDTSYCPSCFKK